MIEAEARALGLPTATVTFLLLTGERPANGEALLTHPDVASEVALSSFTDAGDALVAAIESQRGGDGRWAVHTGEVIETAPTIGPTLDRGLALLAIGGNGQILVSASTAALSRTGCLSARGSWTGGSIASTISGARNTSGS